MACTIKVNGNAQSVDIEGKVGLAQDINRHHHRFFGAAMLRFLVTTAGMIATLAMIAEAAGSLKLPVGYRHWFHVNTMVVDKASPLFAVLGGMHNVHVNSTGEPALKKGAPYPNGTMLVIDLHDFAVVDGSYVEGSLKGVALMEKDSKKYASTGGWGFQFWAGGDPKKAVVTDATKQCFGCHQPKKDQDYVYSTYVP
jgi:Cytochrome P460